MSERVKGPYTPELFATQLRELTETLLGDRSFFLFGTSMGGAITTTFSSLYPEKVKKLILLAPAGMNSFRPPFYMKLAKQPILGDLIFFFAGVKLSMGGCAKELLHAPEEGKDDYVRKFAHDAQYKGLGRCLLSSLRHTILDTKRVTKIYEAFAEKDIPTLVLWGTKDATMPYEQIDRMREVLPKAAFVTLEGAGHIFLYDEGPRTMDTVLPFLEEQV
ncbi:MAG TPA: alpha/beta hydrolase, partial [Clostridiales bacterium]|nr:alpha/beta hydrolase [Clostridiales bacterium]